ncbi:MAG: hypothetical protein EKK52_03940 [Burkholderiales bacterium]|nr:MAG: hypothetical protein EKK52_03940 [Burkholderiales bacterium]
MKRILLTVGLWLALWATHAHAVDANDALRQRVAAFLDEWHDDAAHSRQAYFDKIAPDGVYIGTDKTERWVRDDFKRWAAPYFAKPSAWAFKATKRHIASSEDGRWIWFDEQLETQMGLCQASGVIRNGKQGLRIAHYQLSLTVPNELVDRISQDISAFEKAHPAK